jgi:hypothetical protein
MMSMASLKLTMMMRRLRMKMRNMGMRNTARRWKPMIKNRSRYISAAILK